MDVKNELRRFILEHYLQGESPANLTDDMPLRSSAILDSFATLDLIEFVRRQFQVDLDVFDTSIERFDHINDIVTCVSRKLGAVDVESSLVRS